jgi:hypothetical protein
MYFSFMRTRPYTLLLHPVFLISLALLLLNDFYLKYEFHNWLTGKLSDFAGLFVFAIFLVILFAKYRKPVFIFCILFFCWWKSPLSSSFIYFFNYHLSLPLQRVVDYTDLFALFVLPLAYRVKPPGYSASFIRSAVIHTVGMISLFSFCATSMPRHLMYQYDRENEIHFYEQYVSSLNENEILKRLDAGKNNYRIDSVKFYRVRENDDFYYRIKNQNDSGEKWVPITNSTDSALFVRRVNQLFYIIPQYVLERDTLYNLELHIYQNKRKNNPTSIEMLSFQTKNPLLYEDFYYGKKRNHYKRHFKALFSK